MKRILFSHKMISNTTRSRLRLARYHIVTSSSLYHSASKRRRFQT